MTVALLDGDIIAFRCAVTNQDEFDGEFVYDPRVVSDALDRMVKEWQTLAKAGTSIVCLSSPDRRYFRHLIYPAYKQNRSGLQRPVALDFAIDYLHKNYKIAQRVGLEADDVMGIFMGKPELTDPVIVSIDKDMMTIPGKIMNPGKMLRPMKVSKQSADRMVFYQALVGDSTDGYPGAKGIGPKKAEKILAECAHPLKLWLAVVEAFGGDEEQATLMVQLAKILRHEDYNEGTGEVRLWNAKNPNLWITSTQHTTTETDSKPLTTSLPSAEISPETKQSSSETSLNTSPDTEQSTQRILRKTSRKRSGTSNA